MADGESVLHGVLEADDTAAILECVAALGAKVSRDAHGLHVQGGTLRATSAGLQCRESAATLRFLMGLAATIPGATTFHCAASLARRPVMPLVEAVRQVGAACDVDTAAGVVTVVGIPGGNGRVRLRGDVSSQFVSALLLSGTRYDEGLEIELDTPLVSERYVMMTMECMRAFGADVRAGADARSFSVLPGGYTPQRYVVEGDWSGAAALLALGALVGDVAVVGLNLSSLQADTAIVALLRDMNVNLTESSQGLRVQRSRLKAVRADLSGAIDLLPVAVALGAAADGVTTLTGVARARDKESDRVAAMAEGLERMGVAVEVGDNHLSVHGGGAGGAVVSSAGDHRIAMAFGALGAAVGDVVVEGAECVNKTYPEFWAELQRLGVEVQLDEQ
jgi:3-phosphoshikimate 1-carboxyvinyltransferase